MRRPLVLLFAIWLLGSTVLLSACAEPAIPHPTEGRSDCLSCHGQAGVKPYPQWHAQRAFGNDNCVTCHKLAVAPSAQGGQR